MIQFTFDKLICLGVGLVAFTLFSCSLRADDLSGLQDWKKLNYKPLAEDESPVQTLRMISQRAKANFSKLHTLSVSYRCQEITSLGDLSDPLADSLSAVLSITPDQVSRLKLSKISSGDVILEWDTQQSSYYSHRAIKTCSLRDIETGKEVLKSDQNQPSVRVDNSTSLDFLNTWNAIVTPDHYLHLDPTKVHGRFALAPNAGPVNGRAAFREPSDQKTIAAHGTLVINPISLFGNNSTGWEEAERIATLFETLAGPELPTDEGWQALKNANPKLTVKRADTPDGPIFWVRVELTPPGAKRAVRVDYRFDGRVGYNMIQQRTTGPTGKLEGNAEWSYGEYNDVFVPTAILKIIPDRNTERIAYQLNLDIQECSLNQPLSLQGFTYYRLGLKDGERVVDKINRQVYILQKGNLIPVKEDPPEPSPVP